MKKLPDNAQTQMVISDAGNCKPFSLAAAISKPFEQ